MPSALALTLVIQFANLAAAPDSVVREAQTVVASMLSEIGITVEWTLQSDSDCVAANRIRLTILPSESGSLRPTNGRAVLGAATRTALGSRIALVFYKRVVEESEGYGVAVSRVLACAMAHEIGHLLQEIPAHEDAGLMRGIWGAAEFRRAATGQLRFGVSPLESLRIQRHGFNTEQQ